MITVDSGLEAQPSGSDLVRPFVMTGGRTESAHAEIRLETLVECIADLADLGLPEELAIAAACGSGPTSVAEIGAYTGLAVGVVTILVGDLLDAGAVRLHQTDPVDIEVSALSRMIERVRAL